MYGRLLISAKDHRGALTTSIENLDQRGAGKRMLASSDRRSVVGTRECDGERFTFDLRFRVEDQINAWEVEDVFHHLAYVY